MTTRELLEAARAALIEERRDLTVPELLALAELPVEAVPSLAAAAHEVRLERCGPAVEVEGILSAKTGGCPEDCAFCSQSSLFDSPVRPTGYLPVDDIVGAARETERFGASEFCIVLAIRGPDDKTIDWVIEATEAVRRETGLNVACSLGILTRPQAERLAAGEVHRYNHNLETARSFFSKIVTTHTWEERFETCLHVRSTGMELCCGALLGMGETDVQRVELLDQLRDARPAEVPINFLNPRPGTPLGGRSLLEPLEAIKWISLFRLALPDVILRYAGGREVTLRELQALGLTAGINALIVGNYLTTLGRDPQQDIRMLADLHMPIGVLSKVL